MADVLRHEAGFANSPNRLDSFDLLLTENIKQNAIGRVVEKQNQTFAVWGKREYHAITRGWVANEIFRRIHPQAGTVKLIMRWI